MRDWRGFVRWMVCCATFMVLWRCKRRDWKWEPLPKESEACLSTAWMCLNSCGVGTGGCGGAAEPPARIVRLGTWARECSVATRKGVVCVCVLAAAPGRFGHLEAVVAVAGPLHTDGRAWLEGAGPSALGSVLAP